MFKAYCTLSLRLRILILHLPLGSKLDFLINDDLKKIKAKPSPSRLSLVAKLWGEVATLILGLGAKRLSYFMLA